MVDSGTFKTSSYLSESKHLNELKEKVAQSASSDESVRRPIDPSTDLEKLDVCFGGFAPTAMGKGHASVEQVEVAQKRAQERKEVAAHAAAVEAARASEQATFQDEVGNQWQYVVLDDVEVRIEHCECAVPALQIPAQIDGKPVVSLAAEACAAQLMAESIAMPDTIVSIGYCAFRGCDNLRSIRFSASLAKFDSGWLRACRKLEELTLPGQLEKITPAIFDTPALKQLHVGPVVAEVAPGAFGKSQLEAVAIDPSNEFLSTDGHAIYTNDGSVMIALATPTTAYEVADGCLAIARKGFSNFKELQKATLPDCLQIIDAYAFAQTGITAFDAPAGLKDIGERAFFGCTNLAEVTLNEGLEAIGNHAFDDTAITELRIPASVRTLGHPIAAGTSLTYSGPDATFSIGACAEDAGPSADQTLILDEDGALYMNAEDGLHLVRVLEPAMASYQVKPGTVAIDEGAFVKHPALAQITIPEGVVTIGKGAFKDCKTLVAITLPDTLAELGEEAFLGTNIESIVIPADLQRIGALALVTEGAHHGTMEPSLKHIEVKPGNQRYYMDQGLLIEHLSNGSDRIIICTCEVPDVVIPEPVTAIAQYAFNNARRLRTLSLSERLQAIDVRGLAFDCLLENLHVDGLEPVEGRTGFDFDFPHTSRAAQQMRLVFGSCTHIDIAQIFDAYDNAIVSRSGFGGASEDQLGAYEQGTRVVVRLSDPIFMTPNNKSLMETSIRNHLDEICVDAARHDDKKVIEGLLDLGFIDGDNIAEVIEAISAVQDASVTNYLLEQKQRRFGASAIDFDL